MIRPWFKFTLVILALSWYLGILILISLIRGKSIERGFRYRRKFCRRALSILGIQYQHHGISHHGPCLYFSNHRSMLDPLIQLGYIDAFIVSKAEVGHYPILGRGGKETGIIFVDRENQQSRKTALDAIESTLTSGYPVLIYPEGTTHGGPFTGDFKRGAFELAQKLNIPVIPVMIEYPGPEYYWIDGPLLGYFKKIFSKARRLRVSGRVGASLDPGQEHQLLEKTKSQINTMIREHREQAEK